MKVKGVMRIIMFIGYLLNIAFYLYIWFFVLYFFRKNHNETYQQIKFRINAFFLTIQVFLILRAIIYYILCLAEDGAPKFALRYAGDVMLYFSEIFLAAFIVHLSLKTLNNNQTQSVGESFRNSNVLGSFVRE